MTTDATPPFSVRPLELSDATSVAALAGHLGYPTTPSEVRDRMVAILSEETHSAFVAEDNRGVVGWVHVFGALRLESEPFAEVGGLVVEESCRRRGIGEALMETAEGWAERSGYATVRVRSNVVRGDAHRFYQRLGYTRPKTQANFVKAL